MELLDETYEGSAGGVAWRGVETERLGGIAESGVEGIWQLERHDGGVYGAVAVGVRTRRRAVSAERGEEGAVVIEEVLGRRQRAKDSERAGDDATREVGRVTE